MRSGKQQKPLKSSEKEAFAKYKQFFESKGTDALH
jgi:hypothetical protein